ncbi:hypothetical protein D4R78_02150 [bacterium]|nr:MAG: hypothetical protein D4R78_02150 [bacterium]
MPKKTQKEKLPYAAPLAQDLIGSTVKGGDCNEGAGLTSTCETGYAAYDMCHAGDCFMIAGCCTPGSIPDLYCYDGSSYGSGCVEGKDFGVGCNTGSGATQFAEGSGPVVACLDGPGPI